MSSEVFVFDFQKRKKKNLPKGKLDSDTMARFRRFGRQPVLAALTSCRLGVFRPRRHRCQETCQTGPIDGRRGWLETREEENVTVAVVTLALKTTLFVDKNAMDQ